MGCLRRHRLKLAIIQNTKLKDNTMKSISKNLLFFALALTGSGAVSAAITLPTSINWGSEAFSTFKNSANAELSADYKFQLGAFAEGFTPTWSNNSQWLANWRVFDQADFNSGNGIFTGAAEILPDGTSSSGFATPGAGFHGLQAYVWGFNDPSKTPASQWVMVSAAMWEFPTADEMAVGGLNPLNWSLSDLSNDYKPLVGSRLGGSENGDFEQLNPFADLQFALVDVTAVPEPAAVPVFLAMALAGVFHRRRLIKRC
jgi:hypothetical protein